MEQRSWLSPVGIAAIVLAGVLVLPFGWLLATPGLSGEQACRNRARLTEGYAPWEQRLVSPAPGGSGDVHVTFHDGFNSLYCAATHFGGIWYVHSAGQTLVACGRGPDDGSGSRLCPRSRFGVK
ncbi:MAG TPA: hypothetical protein VFS21_22590 [Roseiflexaceae bacterium]|nr:hypothetical protein [Roseiflexaceae bacterium]